MKISYEYIDIQKIAKEMTREEFLNEVGRGMGKFNTVYDCPENYKLDYFKFGDGCNPKDKNVCRFCWAIATRNIRFKGE